MSEPYQYTALPDTNSIRLIYLEAAKAESPLRCQLKTIKLGDLPSYEAISYAWGEPVFSCDLWIADKKLNITPSLFGALQQLRPECSTRVLWADAVCINQEDIEERSQQLLLMRVIYKKAFRVLIWLGPCSEEVPIAWALALQILTLCQREEELSDVEQETCSDLSKASTLPPSESPEWAQLNSFLDRPYFHRAWIVQEVQLACNGLALCGGFQMQWNDLVKVSYWLTFEGHTCMSYLGAVRAAGRPYLIGRTGSRDTDFDIEESLFSLLCKARQQSTTDPRDKVYSVLGLAKETLGCKDLRLLPDYSKSTAQVYRDAIRYIIETYSSIDVLSMVQSSESFSDETLILPSWVPRLDIPYRGLQLICELSGPYHVHNRNPVIMAPSRDEDTLILRGVRFDLIDNDGIPHFIKEHSYHGYDFRVDARLFGEIWKTVGSKALAYTEGWERLKAFYMTMTASKTLRGAAAGKDSIHWASIWKYEKQLVGDSAASRNEPPGRIELWKKETSDEGDPGVFEHMMREMCKGRKIFTTSQGYIGLGPNTLRPGDVVCILFGSEVPYVLRNKGSHWQFIGECYVHGIMEGEALRGFQGDVSRAEVFELR